MKFTIIREKLLEPLLRVSGIIEQRQTSRILSNVLLVAKDNTLSITGTDTEMELVMNADLVVHEPGETTISVRKLVDICRTLPSEGELDFSQKQDGDKVTIQSGKSRFVLGTLPAITYPNTDFMKEGVEIKVREGDIKGLIELTQFAIAHQDVRYWLNGLLLEISKENVSAIATDGHRLALAELSIQTMIENNDIIQIIVPKKAVRELARMLGGGDEKVALYIGNNALQVEFFNAKFTTKLIDGKYPEYKGVFPDLSRCNKEVCVEREKLQQMLARSAILCGESHQAVKMMFEKDLLRVSTWNMEQEEAEDELNIDYNGEYFEIGFNVAYLLDAIGTVPTKEINMYLMDADSSCMITPVGRKDCRYVVMPVRF
uniref:Beta sliding clamp n=1 Tax=Candidatus Kentrum sp. TUN TaxID=2126343 RepID=A0A450ZTL7_9GAMM|nr:MAG: DNA polymerase III, beta subunit [Candidatus Kentron sp. TUN]VFK55344.1 MAG: DNA polymerase III, beta subunit [Candidatus Kentron sp. TUN]VFK57107.1 MAG: DNA polymerase III, beta subunit [Candidatus Kentron sp. TUN]